MFIDGWEVIWHHEAAGVSQVIGTDFHSAEAAIEFVEGHGDKHNWKVCGRQ